MYTTTTDMSVRTFFLIIREDTSDNKELRVRLGSSGTPASNADCAIVEGKSGWYECTTGLVGKNFVIHLRVEPSQLTFYMIKAYSEYLMPTENLSASLSSTFAGSSAVNALVR
jgi:hypothetical protein